MTYEIKTLSCNPAKLKGLSEKLIVVSHYETLAVWKSGKSNLPRWAKHLVADQVGYC